MGAGDAVADDDARSESAAVDGDVPPGTTDSGAIDAVLPVDDEIESRIERVRRLSRLLDSAVTIPRTDVAVGLDPILGLLPVVATRSPRPRRRTSSRRPRRSVRPERPWFGCA